MGTYLFNSGEMKVGLTLMLIRMKTLMLTTEIALMRVVFLIPLAVFSIKTFAQTTVETVFEIGPSNTPDQILDFEITGNDWVITWNENVGGDPWTNYDRKVFVTKLDENWQTIWTTELGGNQYDSGGNLIALSDGSFCVAALSRSLAGNLWSVSYVAKMTQEGAISWDLTTGGESFGDNYATGLFEDLNGNIVLYGTVQHHAGCAGYANRITQISPGGEINWSNCSNDLQYIVSSPILSNSGNYIYGSPIDGISDLRVVTTNGTESPLNTYDPFGSDWTSFIAGRLEPTWSSNFVLAHGKAENPVFAMFEENGNVLWEDLNWPTGFGPVRAQQITEDALLVLARGDGHFFRVYNLNGELIGESDIINNMYIDNHIYSNGSLYACGHRDINDNQQGVIVSIDFPALQSVEEEVAKEECFPASTPLDGLIGFYPFCETTDDFSGNELHASVNGAAFTEDRNGVPNAAMTFDGVDDFLSIAHDPLLEFSDDNSMSISYWVKINNYPPGSFLDIIMSKQSGSGNSQSGWNVAQNSTITQSLSIGDNGNIEGIGVGLLDLNQWYQVTLTRDAETRRAYLNGQLVDEQPVSTSIGANSVDLLIGKANWNNINAQHFDGSLDDIAIYNRALDPNEVNYLYWEAYCEPCSVNHAQGDLDCDGTVGVNDLLFLLSNFGNDVD